MPTHVHCQKQRGETQAVGSSGTADLPNKGAAAHTNVRL